MGEEQPQQRKEKKSFRRQHSGWKKRVKDSWRRPHGTHSKMRKGKKGYPKTPNIGYRTSKDVRGLHPSGREEVYIEQGRDIEEIDDTENVAIRLASTIGRRKKEGLIEKARERGLPILNVPVALQEEDDT